LILIARAQQVTPLPYLLAAAMLSNTGGIGTLVGDPPNIMIGSAADIDFNPFLLRMGPIALVAWFAILAALRVVFRKELAEIPGIARHEPVRVRDRKTWAASMLVLGGMIVLFTLHGVLHWDPWFVAVLGMVALLITTRGVSLDVVASQIEVGLLMFFIGLFMIIGGVDKSGLLTYLGESITPFVRADPLTATLTLMWVAAFLSALIDNIPFTAAMIPVIQGLEAHGLNVTPLYWALAVGVGLGGNGTHIGSTANVYVVTISERLAREQNDPSLAITPGLWIRKGTPATLLTLLTSTLIFWLFFDFFAKPIH
jgi:Na+/H+ antiporter NhaD/arsenite permease-like protein